MKTLLNNRVFQHILFWCFYVFLYTSNYAQNGKYGVELLITLIYLPLHLLFTYCQLYYLIPRFLLTRKLGKYILLTLIFTKLLVNLSSIAYAYIVYPIRTHLPSAGLDWQRMWTFTPIQLRTAFSAYMICSLAVSIKLLKKWFYEKDRNQQMLQEKLNMELDMLKAQVHPHFLFNTLNNLYSLTLTKSENAPVVVTHLSDLLRYMLYECNEKEVPLAKEMEVLKKYVELEKLRYGDRIDVSFSCTGNIESLLIAPLLLLPFVENSFKHGISEQLDQCWISIHAHAAGDEFYFTLSNSYQAKVFSLAGGIGLQNIRQRLNLIYPERYSLDLKEENNLYLVKLRLRLNAVQAPASRTATNYSQLKPAASL